MTPPRQRCSAVVGTVAQVPEKALPDTTERFLLNDAPMRTSRRGIALSLAVSLLALGLAVYGARVSPAEAPPTRAAATSLAAARFFVLLPDGRVEISDGWGRRVFKWNGQQWMQVDSLARPRPDSR